MMNDKEKLIEKISNEIMQELRDRLVQIDKEFNPEKASYSAKSRIKKMIDCIPDDKSVLGMIGFAGFKDGSGLLFGKTDEYTFDTLSLLIAEAYEQSCDDKTDGVGFEDFFKDLADNARMARILTRWSKNNERN